MKTFTFRIEDEKLNKLKAIAKKEDRKPSQVVRMAIKEFLRKKGV